MERKQFHCTVCKLIFCACGQGGTSVILEVNNMTEMLKKPLLFKNYLGLILLQSVQQHIRVWQMVIHDAVSSAATFSNVSTRGMEAHFRINHHVAGFEFFFLPLFDNACPCSL